MDSTHNLTSRFGQLSLGGSARNSTAQAVPSSRQPAGLGTSAVISTSQYLPTPRTDQADGGIMVILSPVNRDGKLPPALEVSTNMTVPQSEMQGVSQRFADRVNESFKKNPLLPAWEKRKWKKLSQAEKAKEKKKIDPDSGQYWRGITETRVSRVYSELLEQATASEREQLQKLGWEVLYGLEMSKFSNARWVWFLKDGSDRLPGRVRYSIVSDRLVRPWDPVPTPTPTPRQPQSSFPIWDPPPPTYQASWGDPLVPGQQHRVSPSEQFPGQSREFRTQEHDLSYLQRGQSSTATQPATAFRYENWRAQTGFSAHSRQIPDFQVFVDETSYSAAANSLQAPTSPICDLSLPFDPTAGNVDDDDLYDP